MVDIDERVVSLKFDSSDFEKKTKSTFSILDKLHEKLSFKDVNSQDALSSIAENVEKIATKSYSIFDRMVDKMRESITNKLIGYIRENTIGQLAAGWNKYADMTTSVATLKAQGYAMSEINDQLERLNYFTDETSYKFTDMVREIGKFTASGQSLEDATTAMMGIADWAALSGKNASEASRAMYQLSQALGAGYIRKEDWKSIQNLNMDTKEFRQNAIDAAVAIGTLKDNLNGTYTTAVGKKAGKMTFNLQEFTENLTEGQWFTTDVMMSVYTKYSEAVDKIRAKYTKGQEEIGENYTTAQAIRDIKASNKEITNLFKNTGLDADSIDEVASKWSTVKKFTSEEIKEYATLNKLSEQEAETVLNQPYNDYVKEYTEIFKESTESADQALEIWGEYVSQFGIKAFASAQEAKTFKEAIESAMDAASTVWTSIYTSIFGDYDEAKEIWTDFANALYEIFVSRLWSIADIFTYWRHGEEDEFKDELGEYQKELAEVQSQMEHRQRNGLFITEEEATRFNQLKETVAAMEADNETLEKLKDIKQEYLELNASIYERQENGGVVSNEELSRLDELQTKINDMQASLTTTTGEFRDGRKILFQGLYAFGNGFKSILVNFRQGWDELGEENGTAKKLLDWSEKVRVAGFNFYKMMKELGESDFYRNIAQAIKNILTPIRVIKDIISGLIRQFLPSGTTFIGIMVKASETIKNITSFLVPSEETLNNIFKIARGLFAVIKLVAKVIYGAYLIAKPALSAIFGIIKMIGSAILEALGFLGDIVFNLEEAITPLDAAAKTGEILGKVLGFVLGIVKSIAGLLLKIIEPALKFVFGLVGQIGRSVKNLFGGSGNGIENATNKVKGFATSIKEAWFSTESFASIFERFKNGSGISNFLQLLGALAMNVADRIKAVIVLMFGLDNTMETSNATGALGKLKEVLTGVMKGLMWLYTNLIKPVFSTFIEGLAACFKTLGDAFRTGDLSYILKTLREVFLTLSSMELVRLSKALAKVIGSGGLLGIFRNTAKALKSLRSYLDAKATEAYANVLMKVVITLGLLLAVIVALTYLPTDKLETLKDMLIWMGVALGVMTAVFIAFTITVSKTKIGLFAFAAAMTSITLGIVVLMIAVKKVHTLFKSLFMTTENTSFGEIATIFAPFVTFFASLIGILAVMKKLGAGGSLMNFATTMAAIAIAVGIMIIAMNKLNEYLSTVHYDMFKVCQSLLVMFGLMAMLAVSMRIMLGGLSSGLSIGQTKSGFGVAIAVLALTLAVCGILVPTLENLTGISERFEQYMQGIAVLASCMLSISASLYLMTVGTKGGLHILAAAFVFNRMTYLVRDVIIPMMESIKGITYEGYMGGITALGVLMLAMAGAVRIVLSGIAQVVVSFTEVLKPKTLISLGAMVLLIMGFVTLMGQLFGNTTLEIDITAIITILGSILVSVIAMSIFTNSMLKRLKDNKNIKLEDISKIFTSMALVLLAILGGVAAIMSVMSLYKNNEGWGLAFLITTMIGVMGMIIGTVLVFKVLIKQLSTSFAGLNKTGQLEQISKIFGMMSLMIATIMTSITILTIAFRVSFNNDFGDMMKNFIGILFVMLAIIVPLSLGFYLLFETLGGIESVRLEKIVTVLKAIAITIAAIMGGVIIGTIVNAVAYGDNSYAAIGSAFSIALAVCGILLSFTLPFTKFIQKLGKSNLSENELKAAKLVLITMSIFLPVMTITISSCIGALSGISLGNKMGSVLSIFTGLIAVIGPIMLGLILLIKEMKTIKGVSRNSLIVIVSTLGTIVTVILSMIFLLKEIKDGTSINASAWGTAMLTPLILVAEVLAGVIALLALTKNSNISNGQLGAITIMLLGVVGIIWIVSWQLLPALRNLTSVPIDNIMGVMAGLTLLVAAIGGFTAIMIKMEPSVKQAVTVGALFIGQLLAIALLAPIIFDAFNKLHELSTGDIIAGLAILVVPLIAIMGAIQWGIKIGDGFSTAASKIALGITKIALALGALVVVATMIREILDPGSTFLSGYKELGKSINDGIATGITENTDTVIDATDDRDRKMEKETQTNYRSASPSKVYAQYGKYIDQGLAQGIKKNERIDVKAAKALGVATNESFQKSLGIASPSKVFYENGRFVIQGFMNGVNDEYSKNKNIGTAIGDGISSSLTDSLSGLGEDIRKGIWDGVDMDSYINLFSGAGEGAANAFGSAFENIIYGEPTYSESEIEKIHELEDEYAQLQEELSKTTDEATRTDIQNQMADINKKLENMKAKGREVTANNKAKASMSEEDKKEYDRLLAEKERIENLLNDKEIVKTLKGNEIGQYQTQLANIESQLKTLKSKYSGSSSVGGILGNLFGNVKNGITDLAGDSDILTAVGGFLGMIGGKVGNWISGDGADDLPEKVKEGLNTVFNKKGENSVIGNVTTAVSGIAQPILNEFASIIAPVAEMGTRIGESLKGGITGVMDNILQTDGFSWLMSVGHWMHIISDEDYADYKKMYNKGTEEEVTNLYKEGHVKELYDQMLEREDYKEMKKRAGQGYLEHAYFFSGSDTIDENVGEAIFDYALKDSEKYYNYLKDLLGDEMLHGYSDKQISDIIEKAIFYAFSTGYFTWTDDDEANIHNDKEDAFFDAFLKYYPDLVKQKEYNPQKDYGETTARFTKDNLQDLMNAIGDLSTNGHDFSDKISQWNAAIKKWSEEGFEGFTLNKQFWDYFIDENGNIKDPEKLFNVLSDLLLNKDIDMGFYHGDIDLNDETVKWLQNLDVNLVISQPNNGGMTPEESIKYQKWLQDQAEKNQKEKEKEQEKEQQEYINTWRKNYKLMKDEQEYEKYIGLKNKKELSEEEKAFIQNYEKEHNTTVYSGAQKQAEEEANQRTKDQTEATKENTEATGWLTKLYTDGVKPNNNEPKTIQLGEDVDATVQTQMGFDVKGPVESLLDKADEALGNTTGVITPAYNEGRITSEDIKTAGEFWNKKNNAKMEQMIPYLNYLDPNEDESIGGVITNKLTNATDMINTESLKGFTAMVTSLREDVIPTITPILNDINVQNGIVQGINNAVPIITNKLDTIIAQREPNQPTIFNVPLLGETIKELSKTGNSLAQAVQILEQGNFFNLQIDMDGDGIWDYMVTRNKESKMRLGI